VSLARPSRLDNPFVFHSVFRDQLPAKVQHFHESARGWWKNAAFSIFSAESTPKNEPMFMGLQT
jgi:hypothetical protein